MSSHPTVPDSDKPGGWTARGSGTTDRESVASADERPLETTELGAGTAVPDRSNHENTPGAVAGAIPTRIGRYAVLRTLGQGGFGTVYLARDEAADRYVAIKVPRRDRVGSKRSRDALLREARHASKLKHPNIVTLYEVGEWEDQCYLVYEYIE